MSASRNSTHRIVLALLLALGASTATAADLIDTIVVRFRDVAVSPSTSSLPASFAQSLRAQLGQGFTVSGRTRDGAWQLTLDGGIDVAALRGALNAVRLDPAIAYANAAIATQVSGAGGPPTDRIIVKYRDSTQVALARADVPLASGMVDRLAQRAGRTMAWLRGTHDGANVMQFLQRLPVQDVEAIAASIAQDADVDYAVPDYIRTANAVPTDPCFASPGNSTCASNYQWDLFDPVGGINMPAAWNITTGSAAIRVAILDTGALLNHPDLAGRFVGGYDMVTDCAVANDNQPTNCTWSNKQPAFNSRDANPADPGDWITNAEANPNFIQALSPPYTWFQGCFVEGSSWHGTHVAGTIGAIPNNGIGTAGINWVSPLVPVRVLGKCGGYDSDIDDAMVWASGGSVPGLPSNPNPARVISLSLGGTGPCSAASQAAVTAAVNAGTVVVIAAGNENANASTSSPGNCNGVITVAATNKAGLRSWYSNYGTSVEIAAPGGSGGADASAHSYDNGVLSTLNNGATTPNAAGYNYVSYSGTSMATPHVSGVVSLMLSANASLTPAQVLAKIQTTARPFPAPGPACTNPPAQVACNCTTALCGAGILDAGAAVAAAGGGGGGPTPTTTAVASNINPSTSGMAVTFTATVNGNAPTGAVDFKDGGALVTGCAAMPLGGSGNSRTAQCATSALGVGTHTITAVYLGDAANQTSTSPGLSQVVNSSGGGGGATTTTGLASSPNPSTVGQNVAFTATISGGSSPTGTVNFKDGASSIGGCSAVTVVASGGGPFGGGTSRTATCNTTSLAQGTHSVTAVYSGDSANASSTSTPLSQVVNAGGGGPVATTTTLASAPNPSTLNQNVTMTATVAGSSPTGTVAFKDGASTLASCAAQGVTGSGNTRTATCTLNTLTQGAHSLTAVYSGDAGNLTSTSPAITQNVNACGPFGC